MEYSRMNAMKTNRCWNNIGFFRRCRSSSRDISCRCIRFECDTCDEGSTEAPPLLIELLRRRIVFYFARTVGRLDNPFCGLWPFRSSVSFFFFSFWVSSFCTARRFNFDQGFQRSRSEASLFVHCVNMMSSGFSLSIFTLLRIFTNV